MSENAPEKDKLKRSKSKKDKKDTSEEKEKVSKRQSVNGAELDVESLLKRLDNVENLCSKLRSRIRNLEGENEFFMKLFAGHYTFNPNSSNFRFVFFKFSFPYKSFNLILIINDNSLRDIDPEEFEHCFNMIKLNSHWSKIE